MRWIREGLEGAPRTRKGEPGLGDGVEVVWRRDDSAKEDEHEQARQAHAGDEDDARRTGVVDKQAGWVNYWYVLAKVSACCRVSHTLDGAPGAVEHGPAYCASRSLWRRYQKLGASAA